MPDYTKNLTRDQIVRLRREYLRARRPLPPALKALWDKSERDRLNEMSMKYAKKRLLKEPTSRTKHASGRKKLVAGAIPHAPKVAFPLAHDDSRIAEFYASPEWKYLRYDTIRHYGAKCRCCGRTPQADGVTIHVDHIVSIRERWDLRLSRSNTQVLCGDCNQGKGSRHKDDWRSPPSDGFL